MVVWVGVFVGSGDGVVVMDVVAAKVSDTVAWMDCVFLVVDGDTVGTSDKEGVVGSVDDGVVDSVRTLVDVWVSDGVAANVIVGVLWGVEVGVGVGGAEDVGV